MEAPLLEFCFRITINVAAGMQELGRTGKGIRRVVPITGGSFEGPDIKGSVYCREVSTGSLFAPMELQKLKPVTCYKPAMEI